MSNVLDGEVEPNTGRFSIPKSDRFDQINRLASNLFETAKQGRNQKVVNGLNGAGMMLASVGLYGASGCASLNSEAFTNAAVGAGVATALGVALFSLARHVDNMDASNRIPVLLEHAKVLSIRCAELVEYGHRVGNVPEANAQAEELLGRVTRAFNLDTIAGGENSQDRKRLADAAGYFSVLESNFLVLAPLGKSSPLYEQASDTAKKLRSALDGTMINHSSECQALYHRFSAMTNKPTTHREKGNAYELLNISQLEREPASRYAINTPR